MYEITGITEENLKNDMPWEEVRERIRLILYSGQPIGRVLLGHNLTTNLRCLELSYFDHLQSNFIFFFFLINRNHFLGT